MMKRIYVSLFLFSFLGQKWPWDFTRVEYFNLRGENNLSKAWAKTLLPVGFVGKVLIVRVFLL